MARRILLVIGTEHWSGMKARICEWALAIGLATCWSAGVSAASDKKPPYWASLSRNEAMMRVGPGETFPASWLYRRIDLPVRVVEIHGAWRRVQDSKGATGWMHVRLLRDDPTAVVKSNSASMRDSPSRDSRLMHLLKPGVVGRVNGCAGGWCAFETGGKRGYVRADSLWGATDEQ